MVLFFKKTTFIVVNVILMNKESFKNCENNRE